MKIKELFDRQIDRRINPAVVVSELDDYSVKQEIEEYVFTQHITKSIYKFLNALVNKEEGKTGVWISGYYGSGKSHFIKYLFYCLKNKHRDLTLQRFEESARDLDALEEPTLSQVNDLRKRLEKTEVEEIIFNIDTVSEEGDNQDRITRVFLNQFNEFRGYNDINIALALYLEKHLDKKGLFNSFKKKVEETYAEEWDGNQEEFINIYLDGILSIAKELDPQVDKDAIRNAIETDKEHSVEFLVNELNEYVSEKPDNFRLVFLVDEVSQYIGTDTNLLLNLQSIIEELGSKCNSKVWVVCTAQEDLGNLVLNADNGRESFGKIKGRFETLITLESTDAAFITKKRVLEKNSNGIGALNAFFKSHQGDIENLFHFNHELYQNYQDKDDFILTYPFVPYQFRLISDVIQSFSNAGYVGEGIKDTERSILGSVHFTAGICKEHEVGYFVSFDQFFNDQLYGYLTHFARTMLDRAYDLEIVRKDPFARKVVNTLFMVSNLGESQSISFPANVDNLSLLLMDNLNTSKAEMHKNVQAVLQALEEKSIIQSSEGRYRFLKEDEVEVANLIKAQNISLEDRWSYMYDDVIKSVISPKQVISYGNNNFRLIIQVDDKQYGTRGDFMLKFSIYENAEIRQLAHNTNRYDLIIGLSDWIKDDIEFKNRFNHYVRTQKFISLNTSSASGTRKATLNSFAEVNRQLLREIQEQVRSKFLETPVISNQQVVAPDQFTSQSASSRMDDIMKFHMSEIYRKHSLSEGYANNNSDIHKRVQNLSQLTLKSRDLTPGEEELNNKINLEMEGCMVSDIIRALEKPPFGWKDLAIIDMMICLGIKGVRLYKYKHNEIDLEKFAQLATNSNERSSISIHKAKEHSQEEIDAFLHLINNEIFPEGLIQPGVSDFKIMMKEFRDGLKPKLLHLNGIKDKYNSFPFSIHAKEFYNILSEAYQERSDDQIIPIMKDKREELIRLRDLSKQTDEFIEYQIKSYQEIRRFVDANKHNFNVLSDEEQQKGNALQDYLQADTKPWDTFPQMKKAARELEDAITEKVKELQHKAVELYTEVFNRLIERKDQLGAEEHLIPNKASYLARLEKERDITRLRLEISKVNDFEMRYLKALEDSVSAVESYPFNISDHMHSTSIESEKDIDQFLSKLKGKLMVKLSHHKKIIIK